MKRLISAIIIVCGLIAISATTPPTNPKYVSESIELFKKDAKTFAGSTVQLKAAIAALKPTDKATRTAAIKALRECRLRYKRIEAFMEYFFRYPVNLYNRAPVYELEEPYMEYQSPVGLQYMEGLLVDASAFKHKKNYWTNAK